MERIVDSWLMIQDLPKRILEILKIRVYCYVKTQIPFKNLVV